MIAGMKITVSTAAVERVENYPNRARSNRLQKKMWRKYGPQSYDKPCALKTPFGIVVHPDLYPKLVAATQPKGE